MSTALQQPEFTEEEARGALRAALDRIAALEAEVDQLRAEAQWREATWAEETDTLNARRHKAEIEAARSQAKLESAEVEHEYLRDQARFERAARHAAERDVAQLTARAQELKTAARSLTISTHRLHEQIRQRERVLGAMWQSLKDYRSLSPLQRMIQRPELPEKRTMRPLMISDDGDLIDPDE